MHALSLGRVRQVVLLGAHCDDIAIGAGGLLLDLARRIPDIRVHVLVLTGGSGVREAEERAALAALLPGCQVSVEVLDLPDGRLPAHWATVKAALGELAREVSPELVLAPHRADAHQDHRLLGELAPTAFRDQLILGYEILKWEGDLGSPGLIFPLDDTVAERKVELIFDAYRSQLQHDWFDREAFLGLMRIRGVQCHCRYAEAFYADKLTVAWGAAATTLTDNESRI